MGKRIKRMGKRIILVLLLALWVSMSWAFGPMIGGSKKPTASGGSITISYESYASAYVATYPLVIDTPTGTTDGDLLLAIIVSATDSPAMSTPTGWTELEYANNFGSADAMVIYKEASSEGSTQSFSPGPTTTGLGGIIIRLSKSSGAWVMSGDNSSYAIGTNATITSPAVTVASNGLLAVFWGSDDPITLTITPADMTAVDTVEGTTIRAGAWYSSPGAGSIQKSIGGDWDNAIFAVAVGAE